MISNIEHCASLDFIPAPPQMVSVQVDLLTLRQMLPSSSLHLLWARTHIYIFPMFTYLNICADQAFYGNKSGTQVFLRIIMEDSLTSG